MPLHAQATWQQRFADDRQALERRRGLGLEQAQQAVLALAGRWPEIRQVWIFGSLLGHGFREHSDLDLLVEGLPSAALIEVDLKRAEDLEPSLLQRLLLRSSALLDEACPRGGHGGAA